MCNNESPPPSKESLTVGLPIGNSLPNFFPGIEHYRLQLYHYAMAERIRIAQQLQPQNTQHVVGQQASAIQSGPSHLGINPSFSVPLSMYTTGSSSYPRNLALSMALLHPHHQQIPEEPKPQHSYIGLIAMAILSSPEKKLVLSDIYQHILEHYPYFRRRGPGWRNSIRHNLSLNDCFVKSGRSANGKGHYWAIHPANLEDFRRGDFRRRKAQRKVRRHMGLAVDEEPDSPSPPPLPMTPPPPNRFGPAFANHSISGIWNPQQNNQQSYRSHQTFTSPVPLQGTLQPTRKRQFDVASLLAPDDHHIQKTLCLTKSRRSSCSEDEQEQEQEQEHERDEDVEVEVDVVTEPGRSASSGLKTSEGDFCWKRPTHSSTENQHFSTSHLHNHLHLKSCYMPTNTDTGSSE